MSPPHKRYRRRPLQSADAIAGNEDLMTEILVRLPAKSLCRFKCVSKRWYSLISHPNFTRIRMPKSFSGLLFPVNTFDGRPKYKYLHLSGKRTRNLPFKSHPNFTLFNGDDHLTIMHSCNGLFLCSSFTGYNTEIIKKNYYIYNHTTKQFAKIPLPPPRIVDPFGSPLMYLAFDLSTAPHYKIVLLHYHCEVGYQIVIYSSHNGTWRRSGKRFPANSRLEYEHVVFLNGTIHWTSTWSETSFCLDVDRECLETMPMPPFQGNSRCRNISYFGESGGHLHLICNEYHKITPFDVLEMESDYSNWFVKYHVDLDAIITTFPVFKQQGASFETLHIVREKVEDESYLLFYVDGGMVVSYYFNDVKVKKICKSLRSVNFGFHQYIEILFRI